MRHYLLLPAICLIAGCSATPAENNTPPTTTLNTPTAAPKLLSEAEGKRVSARKLQGMKGMLAAHNRVRQQHSLPPLQWSQRMSKYAQRWAKHLATSGCNMVHRSEAGRDRLEAGENIFWGGPVTWSDGARNVQKVSAADVANAWASEQADYDYQSNSCRPGKQCGHYTQMVWKTTTHVGCGAAMCPDQGQIWVCNYEPAGNWIGQKPY